MKSKLFVIRAVNDWNKLPEEAVEVGSMREFKRRLDIAWISVFGQDRV